MAGRLRFARSRPRPSGGRGLGQAIAQRRERERATSATDDDESRSATDDDESRSATDDDESRSATDDDHDSATDDEREEATTTKEPAGAGWIAPPPLPAVLGPGHEAPRIASAWAASLVAHAALLAAGALLFAARSFVGDADPAKPRATTPDTVVLADAVDLFVATDGSRAGDTLRLPFAPALVPRGGGEGEPRPDSGRAGRGGTDTAETRATNLADRDDATYLSRDVQTRRDRDQLQRIRSAKERASWEDWRAAREPMEMTFVATGREGTRPERRPDAGVDPSQGARDRGMPTKLGGPIGAVAPPPGEGQAPRLPGEPEDGADYASFGLGVRDGDPGHDFRDSAKIARARPLVDEGDPNVPANVSDRPKDTQDSEQESTARSTSIVHASTAGGASGAGPGGQEGAGPTGSGGTSGPGSTSKTLGTGAGPGLDNSPADPRRQMYTRQVQSKMQAAFNAAPRPFPVWAIIEGLQGTAVVSVVIRADGSIASAAIARKSGVDEFDQNARRIALGAGPMPPVPTDLGPTFTVTVPFVAKNPTVLPFKANAGK